MKIILSILVFLSLQSQGQIINASQPYRPFAAASHAPTTIAYVGSANGGNNGGSTSSLTYAYTVGSGSDRFLAIAVVGDVSAGADDISSVTYNGVAATFQSKLSTSASGRWTYLYYLLNPASGSNNVVITAGSNHFLLSGVSEYSGVQGVDNSTTNSGTTTALTTSLTPVANNCWLVLVEGGYGNGPAPGAGTGSIRRTYEGAFGVWGLFDNNAAINPATSTSMQTTRGISSVIDHLMISIKPY